MDQPKHISVLLHECLDGLQIRPDGIYVDGTLGLGGHSYEIAKRLTGKKKSSTKDIAGKAISAGATTALRQITRSILGNLIK